MSMNRLLKALATATALVAGAAVFGCATPTTGIAAGRTAPAPDYATVTATAVYKPVAQPGTQRREAQKEAEAIARRELYEIAGAMQVTPTMTVNDVIARDSKVRSELLSYVRTAELVDWKVTPECGRVQVWMRLDLNRVRTLVSCNR